MRRAKVVVCAAALCGWLVGAAASAQEAREAGATRGAQETSQGPASPVPPPGAGRSADLEPERFARVELTLVECRRGQGVIEVSPERAGVYLDREPRRVAWVVRDRKDEYRWILKKKGPLGKNVLPGRKEILESEHDAFFSAEPRNDPRPGDRWRYDVRVEQRDGEKWKLCARVDPEIFIHGSP
jgi:hypothetical protein